MPKGVKKDATVLVKKRGPAAMSQEARARISASAKAMHARRRAMKEAGSRAGELRLIADVLDQLNRLSPEGRSYLRTLI